MNELLELESISISLFHQQSMLCQYDHCHHHGYLISTFLFIERSDILPSIHFLFQILSPQKTWEYTRLYPDITWGISWDTVGCMKTRRRRHCYLSEWETWCCLLPFCRGCLHHHESYRSWKRRKKTSTSDETDSQIIHYLFYFKYKILFFPPILN